MAWKHYRMLLRVPSVEQRRFYERRADESAWSTRELKRQIDAGLYIHSRDAPEALAAGEDPFVGRPFPSRRRRLYTYRIRKWPGTEGRIEDLRLDIGFHILLKVEFTGISEPRDGILVTSTKRGSGARAEYRFEEIEGHRRALFTYVANLVHVVDGDTLETVAHCGFGLGSPQKLRLRGIDTPELSRRAGERAKQFVRERMNAVDFVVISTARAGKFGRYIADVFYLPGESDPEVVLRKGVFLNRELLEERLATRYP